MKDRLCNPEWWASNQGTLAGIAIALLLVSCAWYLLALLIGAGLAMFAALGMSHWYGWLGFGLFGLSFGVCVRGENEESEPRHRCEVVPLPAPRERIRAMGGGNARVSSAERWDGRRAA